MNYTEITAFTRCDHGALERITILRDEDGDPCDSGGNKLTATSSSTMLLGWGALSGSARIYKNNGGLTVIVPSSEAVLDIGNS
jgi:hypothetical protein